MLKATHRMERKDKKRKEEEGRGKTLKDKGNPICF